MRFLHALAVGVLILMAAAPAAAQSQITTGVIDGVVVDNNGGVLPGVNVGIRNVDTNLTRTIVTGQDGRFAALQLPPGRYTVTFTLSGFSTLVQENVVVTVGQTVPLNPMMKVSGVSETVTVTTEAPAVDTTRTAAASTLDSTTIATTPILGRKFEDLLTLTPGVSVVRALTAMKSPSRANEAFSITSALMAAITRTVFSESRLAASGRRSTSRSRRSGSSRSLRAAQAPSSAIRLAVSSMSSPSRARTRPAAPFFTISGWRA